LLFAVRVGRNYYSIWWSARVHLIDQKLQKGHLKMFKVNCFQHW